MECKESVSLKTVASGLAKYNSDLVAVQEVRRDNGASQLADDYAFCMSMEMLTSLTDRLRIKPRFD
jgi:hypothetical protein